MSGPVPSRKRFESGPVPVIETMTYAGPTPALTPDPTPPPPEPVEIEEEPVEDETQDDETEADE
jgi:hypothetical protein